MKQLFILVVLIAILSCKQESQPKQEPHIETHAETQSEKNDRALKVLFKQSECVRKQLEYIDDRKMSNRYMDSVFYYAGMIAGIYQEDTLIKDTDSRDSITPDTPGGTVRYIQKQHLKNK